MNNREFLFCLVGPIALGASIASGGPILHVDDDAPPAGDGLSWAGAYDSLQDALADAAGGGVSEIRVAQGLYTPAALSDCCTPSGGLGCDDRACQTAVCDDGGLPLCCIKGFGWDQGCADAAIDLCSLLCEDPREKTFQLLNGVVLAGGYAGIGAPDPDDRDVADYETFLSGDLAGNDGPGPFDNNADNSYHVVTGSGTDQTAVIDGFTITGGNANGAVFNSAGGGMLNVNGSPTVTSCLFSENTANGGGGMINIPGNPTVSNCTFSGNTAEGGGGMLNSDSSLTVTNCTFSGNSADDGGGGMANFSSSLTVTNCTFIGNLGGPFGGAGMRSEASNTTLTNCTFSGNTALSGDGGGIYTTDAHGGRSETTLTNCTFSGNTALSGAGGGIYTTDALGGHSETTVNNTITWANSPDEIRHAAGATTTVNYSCVQGGWSGTGANNILADPLFVDSANGDYQLLPSSPCIDAADNTAVPAGVTTDLDGNPRFADDLATTDTGNGECPVVDMGAYEFPTSCPWDLDCDANVGITDFLALLAAWGTDPGGPPDLDGDGDVGITDFLDLLANWGPCQ